MCRTLVIAAILTSASAALLRVGVIGTGCIGIEHLNNLHLVDDVLITAIADTDAHSREAAVSCLNALDAARYASVALHESYSELLASPDVDAVIVCTPNDHHLEVVREAFRTGKHCLVEKPATRTRGANPRLTTPLPARLTGPYTHSRGPTLHHRSSAPRSSRARRQKP